MTGVEQATILPCPDPACGSECRVDRPGLDMGRYVCCNACECSGPIADDAAGAIRRWNAIPRERPWTRVEDGLPGPEHRKRYDIAYSLPPVFKSPPKATVYRKRRVTEGVVRVPDGWKLHNGNVLKHGVTHWREHVPPRHPEAE